METNGDQQVIDRVLKGDVNAFGTLVQCYQKPIFNLMFRMAGSIEQAAELTQEAFIKSYENLERFQSGKRFFPWLYTIAVNLARDFVRKNGACLEVSSENPQDYASCSKDGEQEMRLCETLDFHHVEKALCALPITYREALVLRYHEDLSMKDIAEALQLSVSGAKMRVKRGLQMLRKSLNGVGYEK
jgi:RNA polymerase sigma-70 factor (ECF subfamily)